MTSESYLVTKAKALKEVFFGITLLVVSSLRYPTHEA